MALYAIGDLHLSFGCDKTMDIFGGPWVGHCRRIIDNFSREIREEDTLVLVGDHSWGIDLEECREDIEFIRKLPGRKILTRGNHDLFWNVKKTGRLNRMYPDLLFLQSDYAAYGDIALVASAGYVNEKGDSEERADFLRNREKDRLEQGILKARAAGMKRLILFLHYPPTEPDETQSVFTDLAEAYGAEQVVYAHLHGKDHFDDSIKGRYGSTEYRLVSGDFLDWHPVRIV